MTSENEDRFEEPRSALLRRLAGMFELGDHPLLFQQETEEVRDGLCIRRLTFMTPNGEDGRGVMCGPESSEPLPVVLNLHAHGNRYDIGCDELLKGRPALQGPIGPALAEMGIRSICLDLPCFGSRAARTESAAAKAALWHGRSLAGQMLGESRSVLDWLVQRPDIRADRIGVFGLSMGATLAYWLAAVEPRLHAVAHLCCFADFAPLIESGAHDLHGIYLTIPGLLQLASNGQVAGLIAPRPQFIGLGDRDPLTPPDATAPALAAVRSAYDQTGGKLVVHREAETGHQETPAMRKALLLFLERELGAVHM